MKKKVRKLMLSKETVLRLEEGKLHQVVAGITGTIVFTCADNCTDVTRRCSVCPTCGP